MDLSDVSSEFIIDESGSRLLSESLVHPSTSSRHTSTGHGGADLSLSELSLEDPPDPQPYRRRPFSLLAQPRSAETSRASRDYSAVSEENDADGEEMNATVMLSDDEKAKRSVGRTREEKLQSDLFVLKKLNSAFEVYKDALRETKSSTEVCVAHLDVGFSME
jgi:hypothetical protein